MTKLFNDYFGDVATKYVARPHYPDKLFRWLAQQAPAQDVAWDCGCGSGQASHDLGKYFNQVIATDASRSQIKLAVPSSKVTFGQAAAEVSGLAPNCVDLINVGMAAHWFDLPMFYDEVKRVAKPDALLALIVYGEPVIDDPKRQEHNQRLSELIEPYGSPEIRFVRDGYSSMPFPFTDELKLPAMNMEASMTLKQFTTYLQSRSSVRDYISREGHDPVNELEKILSGLREIPDEPFQVKWPLYGRVARITKVA